MTLKFNGWHWKTIGHLFYAASSFVHHFLAIGEFKLELQSVNAPFGSKSAIFCPVWPWNLTDDLENNRAPLLCYFKLCASFFSHRSIQTGASVRKRPIRVKIGDFLSRVTLKFDEWLYFKLCASFHSHQWIQTGITVRKPPIRVKIEDFWSCVTLKFDGWHWKTIGHLFYATSSFVHHFLAIDQFKLGL